MKSSVLAGLVLMCPAALSGQERGEPTHREARASPEVRRGCQRAAAALLAGPGADEAEERVGELVFCELSGPPALAAAWRNPVVLSNAATRLAGASMRNHDLRILEAVLPIVQDEGEPFEHRLAGLSVLASYLMPVWQVVPTSWWESSDQEWLPFVGERLHAIWAVGPEPIPVGERDRIVEALRGVVEPWDELDLIKVEIGMQPVQALTPTDEARLAAVASQILRRWEWSQGR